MLLATVSARSVNPEEMDDEREDPTDHIERDACVYIRQSSMSQVRHHLAGQRPQYDLREWAQSLGFQRVVVIDEDLGGTEHSVTPDSHGKCPGCFQPIQYRAQFLFADRFCGVGDLGWFSSGGFFPHRSSPISRAVDVALSGGPVFS
jgi:hypothetical protein